MASQATAAMADQFRPVWTVHGNVVVQFESFAGIVIPKRGGIARGICCFGAKADSSPIKSVRNDNS
jgi:hypothetical protein